MIFKKNKIFALFCASFLLTTPPLSAKSDDYPDALNSLDETSGNPRIDLGFGMNTGSFDLNYYYLNRNYQDRSDQVRNALNEKESIPYRYKVGYIEGTLEDPEDVDLINIKIPNNLYFEIMPHYLPDGTYLPYLLTDNEVDYSTLLNGLTYGRIRSVREENDDNEVADLFDNLTYIQSVGNTGTLFGSGLQYNEARIEHKLYIDGQENYTIAISGRGENISFPYNYKMKYYITDQPLSRYHMANIYDETRNVDYKSRYFKALQDINSDPSIDVAMWSYNANFVTPVTYEKKKQIIKYNGELYCVGESRSSAKQFGDEGVVNNTEYFNETIFNECKNYINAFKTRDVLDRNKEFGIGKEAESNYKYQARKFLSFPKTFDFLENNELSKFFFNTDDRRNYKDNYSKLHVVLGDEFLDNDPFTRQSRTVNVINETTGERETLVLKEAECASPYKYKENQINEINYYETSYCLIGELEKVKSSLPISDSGVIGVSTGDILRYEASGEYNDPIYPELSREFNPVYEMTMFEVPLRGKLSVEQNFIEDKFNTNQIDIRLDDQDANRKTNEIETIDVKIVDNGNDEEIVTLTETSENSGVFTATMDMLITPYYAVKNGRLEPELYSGYKVLFDVIYEDQYAVSELLEDRGDDNDYNGGPYDFGMDYYNENPVTIVLNKEMQVKSDATSDWTGGVTEASVNEFKDFKIVDCGVNGQDEISNLFIKNTTKNTNYEFKLDVQENGCDLLIDNSINKVKIVPETSAPELEEGTYIIADEGDSLEITYTDYSSSNGDDLLLEGTVNISGYIGEKGRVDAYINDFYNPSYGFDKLYYYGDSFKLLVNVRDDDLDITNEIDTGKVTLVNKTKNLEKEIKLTEMTEDYCENFFNSYVCGKYSHFANELTIETNANNDFYVENGDILEVVYDDKSYTTKEGIKVTREFTVIKGSDSNWMDFDLTLGKDALIRISDEDSDDWNRMGGNVSGAGNVIIENLSKNYKITARLSKDYSNTNQILTNGNVFLTSYDEELANQVDGSYVTSGGMNSYIELPVEVGDDIKLTFTDKIGPDALGETITLTKKIQSYNLETDVILFTNQIYPEEDFEITVIDKSANVDQNERDTLEVQYDWSVFYGSDIETITLTETDVNSSIFKLTTQLYSTENPVSNNDKIETNIRCSTCSQDLMFTYENSSATYSYEKETSYTVEPITIEYSGSGAINDTLNITLTDPNEASDDWTEFSGQIYVEYSNGESYRKVFYEYQRGNQLVFDYNLKELFPSEMTSEEFVEECAGSPWGEGPEMNSDNTICADLGAKISVVLDKYNQTFRGDFTVDKKIPPLEMVLSQPVYIEDTMNISVSDVIANVDPSSLDKISVGVYSRAPSSVLSESELQDVEIIELLETGPDSGIFEGEVIITERVDGATRFNNSLESKITRFTNEFFTVRYNRSDLTESMYFIEEPILEENRNILGGDLGIIDANASEELNSEVTFYVSDEDRQLENIENFDVEIKNTRTNESIVVAVFKYSDEKFIGKVNLGSEDALFYKNYLKAVKGDYIAVNYLDPDNKLLEEELVSKSFQVSGGFDAELGVKRNILVNDNVEIVVEDQDKNISQGSQDSLTVQVKNLRTLEEETVTLTENSINSGVFVASVETQYSENELPEIGLFGAKKNDEFEFIYIDELNSSNNTNEIIEKRIINSGFSGTIQSPSYHQQESQTLIPVSVYDLDKNTKPFERESFIINVKNNRTNDTTNITVEETRDNSGVFSGLLNVNDSSDESYLGVERDDVLEFSYDDEFNAEGSSELITSTTEIISSQNSVTAILEASDPVYVVDELEITVTDPDLNTDINVLEETTVNILNERTGENEIIVLKEVSIDSDEFTGSLSTVYGDVESGINSKEGEMNVQKDDQLTITHIDDMNESGESQTLSLTRVIVAGFDAILEVTEELKVGDKIDVGVIDYDVNNENEIEQVVVAVLNERTSEIENIVLTETSIDSSKFIGEITTSYSETKVDEVGDVGVVAEDSLTFTYIDAFNSKGEVDSEIVEIRVLSGGIDAELIVTSEERVGQDITIRVIDADENKTPDVDTTVAIVINTRTNEKETVTLIETSEESGVFVADLPTIFNEDFTNEDQELSVIADDLVRVSYEDQFNSEGGKTLLVRDLIFKAGFDGEIEVTTPNEIGNAMIVTVRDRDLNVTDGVDTVFVKVHNERTDESVELILTEQLNNNDRLNTKAGASIPDNNPFVGMVYGVNDMVGFGKGSELETFSGDYLVATYIDEFNSQGQSETLTAKGLFLGADAIVLDKNALEDSAVVGGLVPYTVEVENVSPNDLTNVSIIDTLPAGFRLAKDFVYIGDDKEPVSANGGVMTVILDEIDSNETIVLTYVLKVSSGVVEGAYENKVLPYIGNILVGNESRATVYIQDDPLFNDALVFGKVFSDVNGNGYLDEGEEGIPGVTIAGVDGINVVTDSKGRYSIEGVDGGRMDRGTNYILKVMPETLPEGSKFTTENPRVQRITQGMPSKFNFGVMIPEQGAYTAMVEVRLGEVFFDWDKDNVKDEYKQTLTRIANFIEEQGGGIIIIEGNTDSLGTDEYNEDLALRRASAVYKVLKDYLSDEVYQNIEVKIIK